MSPMERPQTRLGSLKQRALHPQRRSHALRLGIALIVLILSALPIERDRIAGAERAWFRAINDAPSVFEPIIVLVMQLGNLFAVFALALLAYFITRRLRVAADLVLAGTIAWMLAFIVKQVIERGRPVDLLTDVVVRGDSATGFGYVSGHAAVAAALATVASAYLDVRGKMIVWCLALIVAIARVYVGVHFPLDVIGGLAMGWAVGSLVHFLVLPAVTGVDDESGNS